MSRLKDGFRSARVQNLEERTISKPVEEKSGEIRDIVDLIVTEPQLHHAFVRDKQDGALSIGEYAMTVIVQGLGTQAQRLDAQQLIALSKLLTQYADHVPVLEEAAYRRLCYFSH